jgi:NADH:ubiquinone oxidoreductase subunit F (NADH-binding)/NADH:ubiquinone oxidoreductase subunit E
VTARRPHVVDLERRYGRHGTGLLDRLREAAASAGGLSAEAVAAVAADRGLPRAHVHGAASYYADLAGAWGPDRVRACAGTACFARTGGSHLAEVRAAASDAGRRVQEVRCLGYCYAAPSALAGEIPCTGPGLGAQVRGDVPPRAPEPTVAAAVDDPVALAGLAGGGPAAWDSWPGALRRGPEALLDAVHRAGLSGRGGAAFPVARKWSAVRGAPAGPRYVVANGDEGDPGSFADRLLMERDPHRVLEGLALAGLACGASRGFAYVRSEYPAARDALRAAVAEARAAGHLGRDVHGSGIDFDVEVAVGAGSYVAGEETALIASLEGVRGGAQVRPPYPVQDGFERSPTAVNNVETLCAVPWIVAAGAEAYARRGSPGSRGTKLVSLSERFARPGVYEVELGTAVGRVCEDLGGGLRGGARLRSLQVGGPLGGFLGPGELDAPLSYEGMRAAGVELGHGGLVAIDGRRSGAELLEHLWGFAADESCGNCAPCRVGSRRGLELAGRIASEGVREGLLSELERVRGVVGSASLCGLGLGIAPALRSLMRVYADELDPAGAGE